MDPIPSILRPRRFLGSVPTCGSWQNSPALCFDSQARITIPALLFLPTPPVSFPSINPKTCQAGFYTRILSAVPFPVSWLNSPPCWRCKVNAASWVMNQNSRQTDREKTQSSHTQLKEYLEIWKSFQKRSCKNEGSTGLRARLIFGSLSSFLFQFLSVLRHNSSNISELISCF